MSAIKNHFFNEINDPSRDFVDDSGADQWIAIENKRQLMSKERGYEVSHAEAEMHYWFSRIDERIAEINRTLRSYQDKGVAERHPDDNNYKGDE